MFMQRRSPNTTSILSKLSEDSSSSKIRGYYYPGSTNRILIMADGTHLRGYIFAADNVHELPGYNLRGVDSRVLSSDEAFKAFFDSARLKINRNADDLPISIDILGRLHGGTLGSALLSTSMVAGGIFLSVTTGGAAAPLLIGSMLTGAGVSGAIHSATKPEAGLSKEFFKECAIGAATSFATSGTGLCVTKVATKIGEHAAKETLKQVAVSAAKETFEEIGTHLVRDLAKVGIQTTVEELSEKAVIEGGKLCAQSLATKTVSGALSGAAGKVCHTVAKDGKIPSKEKILSDIAEGAISGGAAALVNVALAPKNRESVTTVAEAIKDITKETTVGAVSGAASSSIKQVVSNKFEGKQLDHDLGKAATTGAAIGAGTSFFSSLATCATELNGGQETSIAERKKAAAGRKMLSSAEGLLKAKDYNSYRNIFTSPQAFNAYIDATFSLYINEQGDNLSPQDLRDLDIIRNRIKTAYFENPALVEALAESMLGHFGNMAGNSALTATANSPNIIITGRILVGNGGAFINGVKLPTISLEGSLPIIASDFQLLLMLEAYRQAPPEMKAALASEIANSALKSTLAHGSCLGHHENVSNNVVGHFKNGQNESISMLTGYTRYVNGEPVGGHAIQVTFRLQGSLVYTVIDNYGYGVWFHHEAPSTDGHHQSEPVQLAPFDISTPEGEYAFRCYVENLSRFITNVEQLDPFDILHYIYKSHPTLQNAEALPPVRWQDVGNCTIYNQQPATQRALEDEPGAYIHFMSTLKQFLKAIRDSARTLYQPAQKNNDNQEAPPRTQPSM
jgi:hypothetical protein